VTVYKYYYIILLLLLFVLVHIRGRFSLFKWLESYRELLESLSKLTVQDISIKIDSTNARNVSRRQRAYDTKKKYYYG